MDPFFKNPEVAAAYQIAPGFEADRTVTVIGMFSGPLSNISLPAADRAFAQGTNLFVKKTPAAIPAAPADEKAAALPAAEKVKEAAPVKK